MNVLSGKLDIQQFIEQHSDWEKLLAEKPYCLKISHEEMLGHKLVMLKYNQIDSDFSCPLVCGCRGLILDEDTLEPISFPFTKFFNLGESHAAEVDWSTARVGQKIDGSLIKIVNLDGQLLISTNGVLDAVKAPVAEQLGCKYKSFKDIVVEVLASKGINANVFEPGWTYMFELVSPWTRVVVEWHENDLWYLGRRNNRTFQEEHFSLDPFHGKFKIPKLFPLRNVDQCIAATKEMPWNEEGYVVCDASFNRVKIKSPAYLAAHSLCSNHCLSYSRALELVRTNEIEEICSYFEDFRPALLECKERFWKLVEDTELAWSEYLKIDDTLPTRKDKALWITKNARFPGVMFGLLDKKILSVRDFFMTVPIVKLLKILGYRDDRDKRDATDE